MEFTEERLVLFHYALTILGHLNFYLCFMMFSSSFLLHIALSF